MSLSTLLQNFRILFMRGCFRRTPCLCYFSSKLPPTGIIKEIDPETGELKTKKKTIVPKITLETGDAVSVTTLEEAEKLSKRRDLKLVKVMDPEVKTQRPTYRLMTGAEYHSEDLRERDLRKMFGGQGQQKTIKGQKVLLISAKIAQHDLDTQLRKALKWINKMYEVKVVITAAGGSVGNSEKVYSAVEQYFRAEECDARIVQKRSKGSDIKFQIAPPKYKDRKGDL